VIGRARLPPSRPLETGSPQYPWPCPSSVRREFARSAMARPAYRPPLGSDPYASCEAPVRCEIQRDGADVLTVGPADSSR